jgi:hypothetical protein
VQSGRSTRTNFEGEKEMSQYDLAIMAFTAALIEALPNGTDYLAVKRDVTVQLRKVGQELRYKYDWKK